MSAPKKRTAKAVARRESRRRLELVRATDNASEVIARGLEGVKRPSKLVRMSDRALKRHEDAERLAAAFRRAPEGGDAA